MVGFFNRKKRDDDFDEDLLGDVEGAERDGGFFDGNFKAPHALTADELVNSLSIPQEGGPSPDKPKQEPFRIEMDSDDEYSEAAQLLFNRMMGRDAPSEGDNAAEASASGADGDSAPEKPESAGESVNEGEQPPTVTDDTAENAAEQAAGYSADIKSGEDKEKDALKLALDLPVAGKRDADLFVAQEKKYTSETADELIAEIKRAVAEKTVASEEDSAVKEDEPVNNFALPEVKEKLKEFLREDDGTEASQSGPAYALASVEEILRSVEKKARDLDERKKAAERAAAPQIGYIDRSGETVNPVGKEEKDVKVTMFKDEQVPVKIDVVKFPEADDSDTEGTRPIPLSYQYSYADEDLPDGDPRDEADGTTMRFDLPGNDVDPAYEKARAAREALKKNFKLDEPDENEDETEQPAPFSDYTCVEDAPGFRDDIKKRLRRLRFRIVPTAVIAAVLVLLSTPVFNDPTDGKFTVVRIASLLLMGIVMLINLNTVSGIVSVFRGESDLDTPVALAALAAFAYNCVCVLSGDLIMLGAPVAVELLFCNIGKLLVQKQTLASFEHIADSKVKNAVKLIDEDSGSDDIARGAGLDAALICGSQPAVNITDFFKKCYAPQPYERLVPATLICSVVIGVIAGAAAFVFGMNLTAAVGVAALILCAFCPPAYCLTGILPYAVASGRMIGEGAVPCGLEGAMNIAEANAIVFNADRLFPDGTVNLYQMKVLSPNPIDLAIVEAAAVARAAKSPLADMFGRMSEGRTDMISDPVDSINLEGNMGISGWIKDRRILIGNRLLMETHGIAVPSVSVDRRILEKGYFPVYIACAGVACALFVVGYNVDKNVKYELQRLSNAGVTVLVNSTDPNITEEMICDYFGIYRESVRMLNLKSLNTYKKAVNYSESVSAPGVYSGDAVALAAMLTTSTRLKKVITAAVVANVIGIAAAALIFTFGAFRGSLPAMPALGLTAYQLLCLVVNLLISLVARA